MSTLNTPTPKPLSQHGYHVLGWVFFTFCLLGFAAWLVYMQRPPAGTYQTIVWTLVGAFVVYLVAGIYTFTSPSPPVEDTHRGAGLQMLPVSPLTSYGW